MGLKTGIKAVLAHHSVAFVLRAPGTTVVEFKSPNKYFLVVDPAAIQIPDGPFVIQPSTGRILSVARLCEDTYNSFIGGGIAFDAPSKRYKWLGINVTFLRLLYTLLTWYSIS